MGLLFHDLSEKYLKVANRVYEEHLALDPQLTVEYDDYRRKKMYEDILHSLSFLEVTVHLESASLYNNFAQWLIELMVNLMPDLSLDRVKEHMITHYTIMKKALHETLDEDEYVMVSKHLNEAIEITKRFDSKEILNDFNTGRYGIYRQTYLDLLLDGNAHGAVNFVRKLYDEGTALSEIYVDILQNVMEEIGRLWHKSIISVDQEHYMTSITQMALSQFYTIIFSTERQNKRLLSCSVGSELHEMGARMVSDLFEYEGWDSIYLGAAVPQKALLKSIEKHNPDLVVLSVTMPQHLPTCKDMVEAIKKEYPLTKVAVGGRAFTMTDQVWKKWPVDISLSTARDLIEWAKTHIGDPS